MDAAQVTKVVHDVLVHIQTKQGLSCPPLNVDVRPIRDLERFDSPMSLLATGMVGRRLGITIPATMNIFGDKHGLYSIGKTVALLCKLSEEKKSKEPAGA